MVGVRPQTQSCSGIHTRTKPYLGLDHHVCNVPSRGVHLWETNGFAVCAKVKVNMYMLSANFDDRLLHEPTINSYKDSKWWLKAASLVCKIN